MANFPSLSNVLKDPQQDVTLHYQNVNKINNSSETNDCLLRLAPFAVWSSRLKSYDDLFEAVRLYCGITHLNEIVVECLSLITDHKVTSKHHFFGLYTT
jgi:ADP-ribosylglycohydrolase